MIEFDSLALDPATRGGVLGRSRLPVSMALANVLCASSLGQLFHGYTK